MEAYYKLDKESIWVKSDKWRLIHRPYFDCSTTIYALDDDYSDIRKAFIDKISVTGLHGKIVTPVCDPGSCKFVYPADSYSVVEDFKPWTPADGEEAWYIDPTDRHILIDRSNSLDESSHVGSQLISLGLVFKTEEEGDAKVSYMQAKYRVEQEIARLNKGWKPDFNLDNYENWFVFWYDYDVYIDHTYGDKSLDSSMYLKDEELVKKLIESHKEDLLTILEY